MKTANRKLKTALPFASQWLDRDRLRYHYVDEGDGPPLLCVHGNPTWSYYFRLIVHAFRDDHRVIAVDHIGCGLSDKPPDGIYAYRLENRIKDLEALILQLDLREITLVVHDWGGMIGLAAALRHPQRVARLVLLNTAAFLPLPNKRPPRSLAFILHTPLLPALLVRGLNAFARGAARWCVTQPLPDEVRRAYLAPYDSWNNRRATLRFVQDVPLRPTHPSYEPMSWIDRNVTRLSDRPTLICWGGRDFVFDADYLAEWRRRFPAAEVHEFPEAGHYVLEDAGDAIIGHMRDFLRRHPIGAEGEPRREAVP